MIPVSLLFESIKLFHCSYLQNLKELNPIKVESVHINEKRPSVYASNDKSYASGFSFPWNDSLGIEFGRINNGPWTLEIPSKHLNLLDNPCSMYEIDPSTFKKLDINVPEFISYSKVRVISEVKFKTAKDCMNHFNVVIKVKR
jgi:hypothetical protein